MRIVQIFLIFLFFKHSSLGQNENLNVEANYLLNKEILNNPSILDSLAELSYKNSDTNICDINFFRTLCDYTRFEDHFKWTWRFYNYVGENERKYFQLIGEINWRLGDCFLNVNDNKRSKEFYDKALDFYSKENINYSEKVDFLLSIKRSGFYNTQKLLKQAKEIAELNGDYYLICKITCEEAYLLTSEEKYREAEKRIFQINNYLSYLDNFSSLYYSTFQNIIIAIILQKENKEYLKQKLFLLENREILNLLREKNAIEYSDLLSYYLSLFGSVDPICKSIFSDAKLFYQNNFAPDSYENIYFGLQFANYLLRLNKLDEAYELCITNIQLSKLNSFDYLTDEYDLMIKSILQAKGSMLDYARRSEYAQVTENENGIVSVRFEAKSIQELYAFRKVTELDKMRYLDFLLSQCYSFRGSEYNLSWIKGAKRDAKFLMGKNNSYYIAILKELSYCFLSKNNFKKALKIFKKINRIEYKNYSPDSEEIFNSKEQLLSLLIFNHNYESLDSLFYSIANRKISNLNKSFLTFNAQELVDQKKNSENFYNYLLNYSFIKNNISNDLFLLNKLWRSLNGLSNSKSKWVFQEISENIAFEKEVQLIIEIQKQLNFLNSNNFSEIQRRKILMDSLKKIQDEVELTLINNQKNNLILNKNLRSIDYNFFIDFSRCAKLNIEKNEWTDSSQYLVFISDFKDTLVDYVFIQDGTLMDQDLFDQYRQEATDPDRKTDLTSEKFYNYFWKPIADKIGDAKTVYVSLGGVYNNINLNTIYNPETGKYLLEEKDIRIVNSAREFIMNKERATKTYTNNTASLFGFPNFDGNTTVSAEVSDLFASTRDLNSFWLDSLTRGGLKAKPLPATKTEVENISATLKSKGWQVTNYLADNASETNLKTQQSPRVLHVATHGYFFPDIPMEDKDQTRFLGMDQQQVAQDPMLRSGLLLTGANRTLKGEVSTGENGLLSAAEASLLDLRETELVVLSACETGKGEVKNSEGVYGLRKAFSDAGAQNIIMSLWKVDDKVTQEFMSRFYQLWLNDQSTIREAFHKTQLEIKAKYPQPYYWGAFILVGE